MVWPDSIKCVRTLSIAPIVPTRARLGFQLDGYNDAAHEWQRDLCIRPKQRLSLYFGIYLKNFRLMNLQKLTNDELEHLLEVLPEEIRRREMQNDDEVETERRKRSVFASFEELAKKQGVSLADL